MNRLLSYLILMSLMLPLLAWGQKTEGYSNALRVTIKPEMGPMGKYYALLIANQNYQDQEINDLEEPLNDLNDMYDILTSQYTFEPDNVTVLKDPVRKDMIIVLDRLADALTEKDNLLIFYAGHGYYKESTNQGFWLPADAQKDNTSNWFRNTTLVDYIGAIPTKHTLLISDACFSGSIFKTRKAFDNASLAYFKLYALKSRKGMTSGTLNEVPDRSVFLKYLKKRLTENTDKYVSSEEIYSGLKKAVMNNSPNIPRYGEIQNVGDEGGDFIFIRRD